MKMQIAALSLVLALGASPMAVRAQSNNQDRKQADAEAKADRKADKAQAHADKEEHKALKSTKVKRAAKSQDKADAAAANAASK